MTGERTPEALGKELERIEALPVQERAEAYGELHARFSAALEAAGEHGGAARRFEEDPLLAGGPAEVGEPDPAGEERARSGADAADRPHGDDA